MIIQGSPEWLAARCGKVTASRVADIIAKTKTGYSTSRANYMAELICERLTGCPSEAFVSSAMQWGTDTEPHARAAYSALKGVDVFEVAFVEHPEIAMAGASPDGLIGDDGLLEIKCPLTATHLDTLQTEAVPGRHLTQMQFQLAVTGRQWCDYVSFDPRLPGPLQMFVRRVPRDVSMILDLESEVTGFIAELDGRVADLTRRYMNKEAA